MRVAQCFGFRNIQNLVRKIKKDACEYAYVEVMACPSGCVNGGGQLRPPNDDDKSHWVERVDGIYRQALPGDPIPPPAWAEKFFNEWARACGVDRSVVDEWCIAEEYKSVEGVVDGAGIPIAGVKW